MMHCQSGVTKGIKKGGNPIEVMGMLMGRPDPITPRTLVVTDAFPLPIEGFETRVVADDSDVINHMIALGECLEHSRKEKFMGWYHSHPFDVGDHSHCFLSQTDLSTQLQWQRAEDPHGNPFVAIVVDPLRSIHTGTPSLKAFRAYPPEYNSTIENECPSSEVITEECKRLELWGSCWSRYYELGIEYYMSSHARKVLGQLTEEYLWMRTLTITNQEAKKECPDKIRKIKQGVVAATMGKSSGVFGLRPVNADPAASIGPRQSVKKDTQEPLRQAVQQMIELATVEFQEAHLDHVKKTVFARK
jgi:COP9 signalosome complex subunit 5